MTFENQKIMPMIEINEDESVSGEINHVDSIDSEAIDKDNQPIITKCKGRSKNISYPYHSKYDCLQEADDTITHSDGFLGFKWKQKRQEQSYSNKEEKKNKEYNYKLSEAEEQRQQLDCGS